MHMKNYELHILGSSYDAIQFGSGTENLVMIPGLGDGITTVRGKALLGNLLFSRYAKDYRVTIISRKRDPESTASTCSMAREQAFAMEALGIEKAHILGVSMGGMIAQHLAADHPQMVDRLILAVTAPSAGDLARRNLSRWINLAQLGAFTGLMIDITEKAHPEEKLRRLRPFYSHLGTAVRKMDVSRFVSMAQACADHDATDKLDRITAPTLILGAALDRTLGEEGSHLLHRFISGSTLKIYGDQGHALYEDTGEFHRDVLAFLKADRESLLAPVMTGPDSGDGPEIS